MLDYYVFTLTTLEIIHNTIAISKVNNKYTTKTLTGIPLSNYG